MTIFRVTHNKNYTIINNTICKDKRLSYKAKGIWLYAFSRPDDWSFNVQDLVNNSSDGKDAISAGLKELEQGGYLVRTRMRKPDGTLTKGCDWTFYETPQELKESLLKPDNPILDNPNLENPPLPSTEEEIIIDKVNDINEATGLTDTEYAELTEMYSESLTSFNRKSTEEKTTFDPNKFLTNEKKEVFFWLKSLNIPSQDSTLSWWAKNYSLGRLEEVYAEAIKRKPKSIGAYMNKLLKMGTTVSTGRVEMNRIYATQFKAQYQWNSLEVHQKYATLDLEGHNIEIEFNMDVDQFRDYLQKKHDSFEKGHG